MKWNFSWADLLSRREAVRRLGKGAMLLGTGTQAPAAQADAKTERLTLTQVSVKTLRITLSPVASQGEVEADDFAIAGPLNGKQILNVRSLKAPRRVHWRAFRARVSGSPVGVSVEARQGKTIQSLKVDD